MKQKLIDKILYVFDVTPYEITADGDEADVIKVQQECYEGFVALNPDLADKIVKYNYFMFTVNQLEWAPYVDQPDPKVSPELAWSANTATVTINADDNVYPILTNPNSVTVAYTSSDTEKATINASSGAITLVAAGNTTISAVFEGNDTYEAQTVTYALTVNAEPVPETYHVYLTPTSDASQDNLTVVIDDTTINEWSLDESTGAYVFDVTEGSVFKLYPYNDPVNYSLTSTEDAVQWDDQTDSPHWYISPTEDINISIDYVEPQPEPEPELPASGTVYNFTGYATDDASDPSSTGTITYEGEWEQDTSYVYGTANATFVGSEEAQSVTVYMTKDDFFIALVGGRVPVYMLQDDQLVNFGYGELSEYTE